MFLFSPPDSHKMKNFVKVCCTTVSDSYNCISRLVMIPLFPGQISSHTVLCFDPENLCLWTPICSLSGFMEHPSQTCAFQVSELCTQKQFSGVSGGDWLKTQPAVSVLIGVHLSRTGCVQSEYWIKRNSTGKYFMPCLLFLKQGIIDIFLIA